MSIYSDLIELDYTHEQIFANDRPSTRTFSVIATDTPDGEPLVGISYACDFRAEEEWGVKDLYEALKITAPSYHMNPSQVLHIGGFHNIDGSLIVSVDNLAMGQIHWGEEIFRAGHDWPIERNDYAAWWSDAVLYSTTDRDTYWRLKGMTMPEIRAIAKDMGLKPLPTKDLLITQIVTEKSAEPTKWPAWFHYGKTFIARADSGIAKDVVNLLRFAGAAGTLAMGGGSQVFGSGLSFYDGADVGPLLTAERVAEDVWHAEQMSKLKPVQDELKSRGFGWYFLGKPSAGFKSMADSVTGETVKTDEEVVRYWLNGHTGKDYRQPFGWYTLDELLAEKFVDDARAKANK